MNGMQGEKTKGAAPTDHQHTTHHANRRAPLAARTGQFCLCTATGKERLPTLSEGYTPTGIHVPGQYFESGAQRTLPASSQVRILT